MRLFAKGGLELTTCVGDVRFVVDESCLSFFGSGDGTERSHGNEDYFTLTKTDDIRGLCSKQGHTLGSRIYLVNHGQHPMQQDY